MKGQRDNGRSGLLSALRGGLIAVVLSVALVAAYAFMLQKQWLGVESVGTVNIVIKLVCAAAAALIAVRSCPGRLPVWGAVSGGIYILLTTLTFSLISGEFGLNTGFLADIAMCVLCGAAAGIARNLRA